MANALFDSYRNQIVGNSSTAPADWNGDTMKAALIDAGTTTPNTSTHDFWDDLVGAIVGSAVTLASVAYPSAGKVDCNDFTFTSVTGNSAENLVLFKSTGTNSTSPLCVNYDTFSSGMPVTPNGGDIAITVNASGLFTIG